MPAANFYGKRKKPAASSSTDAVKKPRGKPFQPGQSGNPAGKLPGTQNKATIAAKEFWKALINDPEYQANLWARGVRGDLAPAMESMGWHYGSDGKPREKVDVTLTELRLEAWATREPEKFATLGEQVRSAVALLAEVEKP